MRLIAFVVLAALPVAVDLRAGDEVKPRPKLAAEVQSIVDLARATAPEIFANAIVRLVETGKIPQRELQVELLEDAFHAAASATEPVRLIAIPGTPPDTREMYRGKAGELGLDAISLQARILRNLLTVDRAKARALFDQIPHPALDPRPCEDALVADITPYYEIAAAIAQSTFTSKEKENDAHVQFLVGLLGVANSPGELAAFAGAMDNVTFTKGQWEIVLGALSQKLEKIGADYRSFAVSFNAMQAGVSRLAELGRANQVESVHGLMGSFRKYLIVQMTGARCKPDIPIAIGEMDWFRPALSSEESSPSERRGSVNAHAYFDSGDSKLIGERLRAITRGPVGDRYVRAFIPSDELLDFQSAFVLWIPEGSDVDVLHQKATALEALMATNLSDRDHDRIARLSVECLTSSGAQRQSPGEWLWQVKTLGDLIGPAASNLFRASGNGALLTYLASSGTSK